MNRHATKNSFDPFLLEENNPLIVICITLAIMAAAVQKNHLFFIVSFFEIPFDFFKAHQKIMPMSAKMQLGIVNCCCFAKCFPHFTGIIFPDAVMKLRRTRVNSKNLICGSD